MKKRKESSIEREKRELTEEINETVRDIKHSRHVFANATDPLLLEACVYEIKFLQAKYAFLLSQVKCTEINDVHVIDSGAGNN